MSCVVANARNFSVVGASWPLVFGVLLTVAALAHMGATTHIYCRWEAGSIVVGAIWVWQAAWVETVGSIGHTLRCVDVLKLTVLLEAG